MPLTDVAGLWQKKGRKSPCPAESVWVGALLTVSLLLAPFLAPGASAAKGGSVKGGANTPPSSPLSMTYQYTSLNRYDPSWCLSEDSFLRADVDGVSERELHRHRVPVRPERRLLERRLLEPRWPWRLCQRGRGGVTDRHDHHLAYGVVHHAVLVGSTTSKGVTTSDYKACYMPPFSISSGGGGTPIPGGTWSVTLSGDISSATFTDNVEMGCVNMAADGLPVFGTEPGAVKYGGNGWRAAPSYFKLKWASRVDGDNARVGAGQSAVRAYRRGRDIRSSSGVSCIQGRSAGRRFGTRDRRVCCRPLLS